MSEDYIFKFPILFILLKVCPMAMQTFIFQMTTPVVKKLKSVLSQILKWKKKSQGFKNVVFKCSKIRNV